MMTGYNDFKFDASAMTEFLRGDFMKYFPDGKMPQFDASEVFDAQKKNMDALVTANQAAADAYQALFSKQVEIFEATLTEAKKNVEGFDMTSAPADVAKQQADYAKTAFEKALKNMTELAQEAQKANSSAYEIVSKRIEASVSELQDLSKKFTA